MSLVIDQLNVRFDEHHVIHDLQLQLASEEIVAILGPSGCGKTTLLRTIAGLQTQDTWNHSIEWSRYRTAIVRIAGIGMLFQRPVLFPFKDVLGNILFAYKRKKIGTWMKSMPS